MGASSPYWRAKTLPSSTGKDLTRNYRRNRGFGTRISSPQCLNRKGV